MAFISRTFVCASLICAALPPAFAGDAGALPWNLELLLAQAPAESTDPMQDPAPAVRKPRVRSYDNVDWAARRERFDRMQHTGFNLMMGGVACGAGGVVLMIYANSLAKEGRNRSDSGYQEGVPDGMVPFFVGYISVLVGFPALLTTGIILNRIGNHKRIQAEEMLDSGARLDFGPNSFKVSYSF